MKNNKLFILVSLTMVCLAVYLFKTAPPPLDDGLKKQGIQLPVSVLFNIIAEENNIVRSLYTKEIVTQGKSAGLKFSEDWEDKEVDAGPLPALFLRAVSQALEKKPVPVSLFLGSDFPISSANSFDGQQNKAFQEVKKAPHKPAFFYAGGIKRHVAMFPDFAIASACVDCHNKHPDSPKSDWELGDVMGATTWLYPDETVTIDEITRTVAALRTCFKEVYSGYLQKAQAFTLPPEIGDKWPVDGYFLPSKEAFFSRYEEQASRQTMRILLAEMELK